MKLQPPQCPQPCRLDIPIDSPPPSPCCRYWDHSIQPTTLPGAPPTRRDARVGLAVAALPRHEDLLHTRQLLSAADPVQHHLGKAGEERREEEGCKYQPKLNQNQRKRECRQRP